MMLTPKQHFQKALPLRAAWAFALLAGLLGTVYAVVLVAKVWQ